MNQNNQKRRSKNSLGEKILMKRGGRELSYQTQSILYLDEDLLDEDE